MAGRIQLEELLGQGAMASVWRGRYMASGVSVAVKMLHASYADDAEMRLRFIREGETLAKVKAPGVPQVYEMGDDNGRPFLVLHCVEGVELETMLSQRGVLDLPFVRSLVDQLGATLSGLHLDGVVHRDVKPSNILVRFQNDEPRITLVDFGVAAVKSGLNTTTDGKLTQTGTTVGTPFYMSPEQAFGAAVDHRSDLWAMAVVAYECLSGRVPFEGKTFGALCIALDRRRFVPVRRFRPELPRALDAWFARAFRAPGCEPFESASAMAEAFEAACAEQGEGRAQNLETSINLNETLAGGVTTGALSGQRRATRRTRSAVAMAVSFAIGALGFGVATAASRRGVSTAVAGLEGTGAPSVTTAAAGAAAAVVAEGADAGAAAKPGPPEVTDDAAAAAASGAKARAAAAAPRAALTKKPQGDDAAEAGSGGLSRQAVEAAIKAPSEGNGAVATVNGPGKAGAKDASHGRKDKTGEELEQRPRPARETPANMNWLNERL